MATNYPYFKDLRTGIEYHPKYHRFSDGAFLVDCSGVPPVLDVLQIVVPPTMDLSIIAEVLSQLSSAFCSATKYVELYLPYLPYARADRMFGSGQNFGLRAFFKNVLKPLRLKFELNAIICNDVHNYKEAKILSSEFLPRVDFVDISQLEGFKQAYCGDAPDYVVAPDKGARDKANEIAFYFKVPLITAEKTRDTNTGSITKMYCHVPHQIKEACRLRALVVDDICDGGGTFLALADLLPKHHKKTLFVTHGIFSKGKSELQEKYDNIISLFDWSKN